MIKPYYEHGGITIYHGDCRDILPHLPKVDLVLTDPPYSKDLKAEKNLRGNKIHGKALVPSKDYGISDWDDLIPSRDEIKRFVKKGDYQIIFGGNYFDLPPSRCWLIWDKETGENQYADAEMAWTNFDKPVRLFRFMWKGMFQGDMKNKEERYHPTQKPIPVMNWCIKQAPLDVKTILDPFMGSGTTLRAAKDLGRKAIGIEIEEKYCEIAVKRLRQEVFQL